MRRPVLAALFAVWGTPAALHATDLTVGRGGMYATISAAVAAARPGDRVVVRAGTYREETIVVRTARVTVQGVDWPVLDGRGQREVFVIAADDVTVRGLVVTHTGVSQMQDRAGIRARDARNCVIENNRLRDNLFGIYLQRSADCVVRDNDITGSGLRQTESGNGIHLWYSPGARVERNRVRGHRDGIYFEFSALGVTRDNISEHSQRYGLHFMFSDSCRYEHNVFRDNNSGVAVMYSRGVVIHDNHFERSWGSAAYGLLLKDLQGGEISDNVFLRNSTGLYVEGSTRLEVRGNTFTQNGWAAKVMADADGNRFVGNLFAGNAFDVTTNSRSANSTFDGNWWDEYKGYDLNRDGVGDTPFHPVRLFALVVEQHPPALLLLRSPLVSILDAAERVLPVLTPEALVDRHPLMHRP